MKTLPYKIAPVLVCSLFALAPIASAQQGRVVLELDFENPTEQTLLFPAEAGQPVVFHGEFGRNEFGAWSTDGGTIAVTHGGGFGTKGSGGMFGVVKKHSPSYQVLQLKSITLPFANPAELLAAHVTGMALEFDAKIPAGKTLWVQLTPEAGSDMRSRERTSRLIYKRVTGTGEYQRYRLTGADAEARTLAPFVQFVRDAALNGTETVRASIVWQMPSEQWDVGDAVQMDNVRIILTR